MAGWSTPPRSVLEEVWPSIPGARDGSRRKKIDALILGLKASRVSLYLQQVRHDITFNENGSVKLSINYQAALTGILTASKMDILGPTDTQTMADLKVLEEKVKRLR